MIPVLGIPTYNQPELLLRCLRSIDVPVGRLVIVQNGPSLPDLSEWTRDEGRGTRVEVIRHPNAGVAASWNEIVKLFPAPWWLLVNDDIEFAPGDLGRMSQAVATSMPSSTPAAAFYGNHGASWWAVTALGMQWVGLFDENFYPAYLEDCDWSRRADLAGVPRVTVPGMQSRHGRDGVNGSSTVNATPALAAQNCRTHGGNFEYYRAKWGGVNGEEVFTSPFNQGLPVWAWPFLLKHRAKQQWSPTS